jgi:hypothetical protein
LIRGTRSLEYLTGFLMGAFAGMVIEVAFWFVYYLFCLLLGWTVLRPLWWMMVPIPFFCGIIMARFIAGLHLEDY